MSKITRNGQSLQVVIPAETRDLYGFKAGMETSFVHIEGGAQLRYERMEPLANLDVYTIGYEGRNMDEFLHQLTIRKVKQLIDVRELAYSRKAGFSKSALKAHLEEVGISYKHIPKLGSPSDVRHVYKEGGSLTNFMDQYSTYLDDHINAYDELKGLVMTKPTVLMCFEKEHHTCHREILANRLLKDGFHLAHI